MKFTRTSEKFGHFIPVMLILTISLFSIVSLDSINKLQGNARIINDTGIVRGATQRLIKQELNHKENDALIAEMDKILLGLSNGDKDYNLSVLQSSVYQNYAGQLQHFWEDIKAEIYHVRDGGDTQKLFESWKLQFQIRGLA